MPEPTAHRVTTWVGILAAGLVLGACTSPGDDDPPSPPPTETSTSAPTPTAEPDTGATPSAEDVRATLGTLAPCALLRSGTTSVSPRGPHTCEAQLGDTRVRVAVGVPLDEETRSTADSEEIAGLTAYTSTQTCRTVFAAGPEHGIAVELDSGCGPALGEAAAVVGASLAGDVDALVREPGPDDLTACGLLSSTPSDGSVLVDGIGAMSQGLDHCEVAQGAVLARTTLGLDYTPMPFAELVRRLGGDPVSLAGREAVVVDDGQTCFVHTYLWESDAEGRGPQHTDAVVHAATCAEARRVTTDVIEAAERGPAPAGSVTELLRTAG